MNIGRNNYEVYFIDYYDGALSAEQVAELFLFLESNPDLQEEFNSFSAIVVDAPEEPFPMRDELKRGVINEQNFNWHMAARVEGDLNSAENKLLDNFIHDHPEKSKDAALFAVAKLEAGSEVYPDKKKLKQPVPFSFNITRTLNYAVAAMLFLSLIGGGYFMFTKSITQNSGGVAVVPDKGNSDSPSPAPADSGSLPVENMLPSEINNVVSEKQQLASTVVPVKPESVSDEDRQNPSPQSVQPFIEEENLPVAENVSEVPEPEVLLAESNTPSAEQQRPAVAANDDAEYVSVWEAIRRGAENNLSKAIGTDEDVASADNSGRPKIRIMDVVSKGVEKISNEKVTVDAAYADNGKVSGFRFVAGKFSIEKNNP